MPRKISELELCTGLPDDDEFLIPVYYDNTNCCHKKILVPEIINYLKEGCESCEGIEVYPLDNGGFKIRRNYD